MKAFYHDSDLDGHCSGALIKIKHPECELIGINYGDKFPWGAINDKNEVVFMVDFALQPFSDMVKLEKQCKLIWIDHHISAINIAHSTGFLAKEQSLEDGIGACVLVFKYLFPDKILPTFVKLLGEYDVWNHTDPRALPFQYGMRLLDTKPENTQMWHTLFDVEMVHRIVEDGGIVLKYINQYNDKYARACMFEIEIDKLKCIAINKMLANSQLFDSIWDEKKYHAMVTFGWRNKSWTVSLYTTRNDVDVSIIAKNRGGGGHRQAAGFQCHELPFLLT